MQCSLHAGSPWSHTREEGVKRCKESEPGLISVSTFFISALPERSEIPLVEKWERQENCQSIMFGEK